MIQARKISTTTYPIVFFMADSADHITGKTGLTLTVTLSKSGAAFGAAAGAASEIGSGWYALAGNATDRNTLGALAIHAAATGADPADVVVQVVNYDPYGIVGEIWDEPLTGATHNVATSAGKRVRVMDSNVILSDALPDQTGAVSNSIIFDGGASTVNGAYDPAIITILSGAGVGQTRLIYQYVGASKTAYVDRDWKVQPEAADTYAIIADAGREHINEGLAQGGGASTITLNTLASAATDAYVGQIIFLRGGTGADQASHITAYNGTTKVATVNKAWATQPDATTTYVVLPQGMLDLADFVEDVWTYATRAVTDKADFTLTSDYDDAKTAAQAGDAMTLANDSVTAAALKADAITEIQNGLATPTNITAGTITTVTNLTNLPAVTTDWLTAAGVKADAVTKIQTGLALEATLTAIKGAGWSTETLAAIDVLIDAIKAKTDLIPAVPAEVGSAMTLTAAYDAAKTAASQTSVNTVDTVVDAIKVTVDANLDMKVSDVDPAVAISATEALSVATGVMEVSIYYTLNQTVTSTYAGDLSSATKVWFAIKDIGDTDANSIVFMEKTAGLTVVNKTTYATTSSGGLVISGTAGDWDIAVTVDEAATALLSSYANDYHEASLKALIGGDAVHIWDGECRITDGVIRTIA